MSVLQSIETEFSAIINDARSVPEKLASLVGLHAKTQELVSLEQQLSSIVNGGDPAEAKVDAILHAIGKL